jgi:hypothetical protein
VGDQAYSDGPGTFGDVDNLRNFFEVDVLVTAHKDGLIGGLREDGSQARIQVSQRNWRLIQQYFPILRHGDDDVVMGYVWALAALLSAGSCESSPRECFGVISMKMMSSTRSTSINGVTFMSAFCRVGPPIVIAILLIWTLRRNGKFPL